MTEGIQTLTLQPQFQKLKVDYCSDLHLDFWCNEYNPLHPKFHKKIDKFIDMMGFGESQAQVLIISGDLGHYNQQDQALLLKLKSIYQYVLLVRGNHDMYLLSSQKSKYDHNSWNRINDMKQFCESNNIDYCDGQIINISGFNFVGIGMSWDKYYYEKLSGKEISEHELKIYFHDTLNDGRMIHENGKDNYYVSTAYGGGFFNSSFDNFKYFQTEYEKLSKIQDYDNVDVMISHYVPLIIPNMPLKYKESLSTTFYMFDGDKDIERINPQYWVFGHTHIEYNFKHPTTNTTFLCNPLGYPNENTYTRIKTFILDKKQ